ncbi:MAG: hypothetical protein LBP39_00320 [Rickettsiales bacterium]|jgi:lipopolysaccharide transport protein LptA|nr:hypothetical protein [Rickettsiales bacterium]
MYKFLILCIFFSYSRSNASSFQQNHNLPSVDSKKSTIFIESDEVRIKKNENIIVFTGNVKIRRDKINILAKKTATLYYVENNDRIEPEIIDMIDIIVTMGNNIKITGDKGSYDFINYMLTIEDNVVISEKNSTTFASRLIYNTITEEIEMFGKKIGSDPLGKTIIIINDTKNLLKKDDRQ